MTPDESLRICRGAKALSPAMAVDDYMPDAWHMILAQHRFEDAQLALTELGSEQQFIHVSDIVKRIKRIRAHRISNYGMPDAPPGLTDDAYAEWLKATMKAIGDGEAPPRQALAATSAGVKFGSALAKIGRSLS